MNLIRFWKSLWYPLLPSVSVRLHEKRRKGLFYRCCPPDVLECQREQDRIFWEKYLNPEAGGKFLEIGGDGIVGSHTLGLELKHGWRGSLGEPGEMPRKRAAKARNCEVLSENGILNLSGTIQLLAIHRPSEFPGVWKQLQTGRFKAGWAIVENRESDPQWCRLLERSGYRLRFFFHDDEYFQLTSS
jgi:hypothetical protein